jgi:hypothetical protein
MSIDEVLTMWKRILLGEFLMRGIDECCSSKYTLWIIGQLDGQTLVAGLGLITPLDSAATTERGAGGEGDRARERAEERASERKRERAK